jgi:hypothetical protein
VLQEEISLARDEDQRRDARGGHNLALISQLRRKLRYKPHPTVETPPHVLSRVREGGQSITTRCNVLMVSNLALLHSLYRVVFFRL